MTVRVVSCDSSRNNINGGIKGDNSHSQRGSMRMTGPVSDWVGFGVYECVCVCVCVVWEEWEDREEERKDERKEERKGRNGSNNDNYENENNNKTRCTTMVTMMTITAVQSGPPVPVSVDMLR